MLENDLKNTLGPLRYSLTIRSAKKYTVHASSPVQRYDQPTTRFEPKRTVLATKTVRPPHGHRRYNPHGRGGVRTPAVS